jgi:hypothetical protein
MAGSLFNGFLVQAGVGVGANVAHTVIRPLEVYDVGVYSRLTAVNATITAKKAAVAITDTIACDTDKAVTRASTIDGTQVSFVAGDILNFTSVAADGVATAYCFVIGSGV